MTDDPLPWFPCFPGKWLKVLAGMKPDEGYVYWIVCLRIYDDSKPCADTLETLARRTGLNRRRVSDALDRLFKSGRLVRQGDGITNPFAEKVMADQASFREKRSLAGRAGAAATWKNHKKNQEGDDGKATTEPMANDGYLQLQLHEERKKEVETPAKRRAPRAMIREDWTPSDRDVEYAKSRGFRPLEIQTMARAFVNYHLRQGTLIAGAVGLAACWRTWCDNEVKFAADRAARQKPNGGPSMYDIACGNFRIEQ